MPRLQTDRNLLYGILAVQLGFVDRDALIAAMNAWVIDKARPIGRILVDQAAISAAHHDLLDALVAEHLKLHGDATETFYARRSPRRWATRRRSKRRSAPSSPPSDEPGPGSPGGFLACLRDVFLI